MRAVFLMVLAFVAGAGGAWLGPRLWRQPPPADTSKWRATAFRGGQSRL